MLTEKAVVNHPQCTLDSEAASIHKHWIKVYSGQVIKAYMHNLHSMAVWEKQVLFSKRTKLGSLLPPHCEGPEPGREAQTGQYMTKTQQKYKQCHAAPYTCSVLQWHLSKKKGRCKAFYVLCS